MEVTELTLLIARFGVILLIYVFLLALIFALRADANAGLAPQVRPSPKQKQSTQPAQLHKLAVTGGTLPTTGSEYKLFGPLEIGRSITCNITIPNSIVSSHHARIFSQNGQWMIEDLGSTNGTFLNGTTLGNGPKELSYGDKVLIGDTEFEIK